MTPSTDPAEAAARTIWRNLLTGMREAPGAVPPTAFEERLAELIGAGLVAEAGAPIDPSLARNAVMLSRFRLRRLLETVSVLREAKFEFVCMKGMATAHQLYPAPELRITGDVDLLMRQEQVEPVVAFLRDQLEMTLGEAIALPGWGFVSEASYLPMVSDDGMVNVDIHILPDCYPLYRGLTTEAVLAEAIPVNTALGEIRVPRAEHGFLIALGNATKEKFGPDALKSVIDSARLPGSAPEFDWCLVHELATRAGLNRPLNALLYLLDRLGARPAGAELVPLSRFAQMELARAEHDLLTVFADGFSPWAKLRRELFLTAEPAVATRRMLDRLRGIFDRRSGAPPGAG